MSDGMEEKPPQMRDMDIREVSREELMDIREIQMDRKLPKEERLRHYQEQVKNPYLVRCGEYVVQFRYAQSGKTMNECVLDYVSHLLRTMDQEPCEDPDRRDPGAR